MNEITTVLLGEIETFMKTCNLKKPIHINSGHCKTFSERVKQMYPKAEILHIDQIYMIPSIYSVNPMKIENIGTWNLKKLAVVNNGNGQYPKVFDKLLVTPFHQWIYCDGKHYDAEHVNGVDNLFDLPYFKDYIKAEYESTNTLIERTNQESLKRIIGN